MKSNLEKVVMVCCGGKQDGYLDKRRGRASGKCEGKQGGGNYNLFLINTTLHQKEKKNCALHLKELLMDSFSLKVIFFYYEIIKLQKCMKSCFKQGNLRERKVYLH